MNLNIDIIFFMSFDFVNWFSLQEQKKLRILRDMSRTDDLNIINYNQVHDVWDQEVRTCNYELIFGGHTKTKPYFEFVIYTVNFENEDHPKDDITNSKDTLAGRLQQFLIDLIIEKLTEIFKTYISDDIQINLSRSLAETDIPLRDLIDPDDPYSVQNMISSIQMKFRIVINNIGHFVDHKKMKPIIDKLNKRIKYKINQSIHNEYILWDIQKKCLFLNDIYPEFEQIKYMSLLGEVDWKSDDLPVAMVPFDEDLKYIDFSDQYELSQLIQIISHSPKNEQTLINLDKIKNHLEIISYYEDMESTNSIDDIYMDIRNLYVLNVHKKKILTDASSKQGLEQNIKLLCNILRLYYLHQILTSKVEEHIRVFDISDLIFNTQEIKKSVLIFRFLHKIDIKNIFKSAHEEQLFEFGESLEYDYYIEQMKSFLYKWNICNQNYAQAYDLDIPNTKKAVNLILSKNVNLHFEIIKKHTSSSERIPNKFKLTFVDPRVKKQFSELIAIKEKQKKEIKERLDKRKQDRMTKDDDDDDL